MVAPSKTLAKGKDSTKFIRQGKKPFKKTKDDVAARSEAMALQLEEVPDFPRGGASSLSKLEREKIYEEVDAEFDADERVSKKNKAGRSTKKRNSSDVDELGSLFGGGITGKLPRYANKITIKNISPGMKLLGVVTEVNQKDIVITLPGGLRGLVRAREALDFSDGTEDDESELLKDIFYVGQLVPCIVLHLDEDKEAGKRKIWLSLRLSLLHKGFGLDSIQEGMVLTANVKSVEDHGYILHFGLPSVTGFLPKISSDANQEIGRKTGQLIQGVVRNIDKDRKIVYLSSDHDSVAKCVTKDLKGMSIDLLIPGMMVNARVQSVLENGIMLAFLTYFTGTVDLFHLQNPMCNKSWKDEYIQNKKVNARILFIDPSTRAVGLTLNPHLVCNKAPPVHVSSGAIFDEAKVVRVDKGSGLLLELPSTPASTPAYVSTYDVGEDEVKKLEKKYKEGNHIRVRILALKHMEGLAIGTLKASAFEGPVFTHSDVMPGMVTKAKVISVDTFGAIVQFPGGLKAMCPLRHMSEFEVTKPRKKFKVGADLIFRVLGCKSKRITVTYKKTLVKSKLPILSSYADATEGLVTHGWITKIEKHGCFVRFYNGVQGFVPRFELGLEPGSDPESVFHAGEVVKCRVTSAVHASRRINLSFMIKPTSVSEDDTIKLGSIVSGVIDSISPQAVIVRVKSKGFLKGTISAEHLADHHEQGKLMKSLLTPGYELDKLLVLDIKGNSLVLSSKYSLLKSAEELPTDFSQLQPNSVVHGYICNMIDNGCFVRFLGQLTGFAPRSKAIDEPRANLSESFFVGQSVRANIVDVNQEDQVKSRITLSLKQSSCASVDASFVQEYFLMDEKISDLQSSDTTESGCSWVEQLSIGSLIKGTMLEKNDLGVMVNFENITNVLGFIPNYHMGGATFEHGSVVHAVVLDLSRAEKLVDLSLRPELISNSTKEVSNSQLKKKRKKGISKDLELHQRVSAVVEIVKEQYLVLSIPEYGYTIGYASVSDYNTQKLPVKQFSAGHSVVASVEALQNPSTSGRLLLLLDSIPGTSETSSTKRAKKKSGYEVGSVVQAEITEIKPFEARVNFGPSFRGRIHITEVDDASTSEEPFAKFRVGQSMSARIVAKPSQTNIKKSKLWELSVKPATLKDSSDLQLSEQLDFVVGQLVSGYVYKVDQEWVWLAISRNVTARIYILDTSCEAHELEEFQKRYPIGKAVSGYVLTYNKEKKTLRLVQRPLLDIHKSMASDGGSKKDTLDSSISGDDATLFIHEGDIVGGRISKILPGVGGLRVQIGPYVFGKVHFTEIKDSWVSNPLDDFREGQFVKCKVLEISSSTKGNLQVDLSLRTSLDGMSSAHQSEPSDNMDNVRKRFERIEDLSPDMGVKGYVKNTMSKGCFILLSRKLEAKVMLSNLSDTFVAEPEKEFPVGKFVTGRVLAVEPLSKRIEVTLKNGNAGGQSKSESYDLKKFHIGDMISGRIKRVEPYGLFIAIDQTAMVGLCHKSELSDDRINDVQTRYTAGERVTAKILKLDEEKRRISLGMKSSYFMNGDDDKPQPPEGNANEANMESDSATDLKSEVHVAFLETTGESQSGTSLVLAQVDSRASIPPLEVDLDDMEELDFDNNQAKLQGAEKDEKSKRREKQKEKEEREKQIQAAEGRLLENHAPESAEEFEKLVRSSPNSSFVWIKYMAFMLTLADIEKARSIAERALRTINIREEEEKLNIWVAYFNLENEHGNPPEEAVRKVFERARQYCDPKKVYLALLGVYERTEQKKLADKLLDDMIKKFKQSCKVWLRKVQSYLKQNEENIQAVVNRALLCLPRHKHIKFISQTAILEFKCGVADRGRSMFEGVLREYPKRTDLWSVYLDQEIRLGEVDVIRSLFERAISLSLPPKKMKFLFKKYLEYEKSVGDEEKVEYVKQKAMEYADSALA